MAVIIELFQHVIKVMQSIYIKAHTSTILVHIRNVNACVSVQNLLWKDELDITSVYVEGFDKNVKDRYIEKIS